MDELATESLDGEGKGRFFRKLDWAAFWSATLFSFAVYVYTLAPTVTLEDSGELAVAGDYLGVPHPPGYPIWTLIAWIFTRIFAFVQFRGQPNPAWSIGLMSAVFGALATGISAMLICRSGSDLLREMRRSAHVTHIKNENTLCWLSGVVASLLFAFSPVMWSQSVIVEVYSLNAFFLALIFLLTYQWLCRPSDHLLYLTAFVFGLGLTNYQVLLLAALPLVFAIFLRDIKLFRDFLITGAPYIITFGLIKAGVLPPLRHPLHPTCYVYMSLNVVVLVLAAYVLPRGRTVALTFLLAMLGVGFYGLMPIVSDLRNPPMNWGYPRTWEGFKHAITRGQYERIKPADVFTARFIHQLGSYLTDLRGQFTLPVALLGFLPFTAWTLKLRGKVFRAAYLAIGLAIAASAIAVVEKTLLPPGSTGVGAYKLPAAAIILLVLVGGMAILITQARELVFRLIGRTHASITERVTVALVLLGVVLVLGFLGLNLLFKIGDVTSPLRAAGGDLPDGAVADALFQALGILLLVAGPVLLAVALVWLMHSRHQFKMTLDINSQRWIIATLLGFLAMSLVLIVLANPKGDIQDNFIQRVKFISSHALYAFWIGYGLLFGLAAVATLFRDRPAVRTVSLAAAGLLWLVPLRENAANPELLRVQGGAEQQGHDFGWQFGNYQLRGAEAIAEELNPDEEPLPNPRFPPAMGQDAIFFGGTDPGRFVPTYMIYSARVREDVYLITQNALADNTYMSVMRDLYGDQIWIPAQPDSAQAFQIYVEEVRSGKRRKNADLRIEGGRVQVSGALGVMEINGILAEMIFDHNNYKHDFYVEESYVIRWMYPHLTPHGLIMKINNRKARTPRRLVNADLDFWDWYTRRLASDPKFVRDIVARKSFSKLRSAIAGLYANTGLRPEAEIAFEEARTLYPLSPEANFRLAQEVLMPAGRIDEAKALIEDFAQRDPGNTKARSFIAQMDAIADLNDKIAALEKRQKDGKFDINTALQLSELYLQANRVGHFLALSTQLLKQPRLPPQVFYRLAVMYRKAGRKNEMHKALDLCADRLPDNTPAAVFLDMARMYEEVGQHEKMLAPLNRYLRAKPNDWKAWLDLAVVHDILKKPDEAAAALQRALSIGGQEAAIVVSRDPRLTALAQRITSRLQPGRRRPRLPSLPGVLPGR